VTTVTWRANLATLAGLLTATGLTLAVTAPGAAAQSTGKAPGDNGTVKIHRSTTAVADPRNEPHVCSFYLDAFAFDPAQSVSWQIKSWPPTGDRSVVSSGTLATDSSGDGHTGDMTLSDGHYKLFWNFQGEHGAAKHKVFWVSCATTPTSPPTTAPPTPTSTPSPVCTCTATPSATPTVIPTPTASRTKKSSPTPTPSSTGTSVPPAPAPAPVSTTLPVTG
jgi:hypothetical protein